MADNKTPETQLKASKKYKQAHPDKIRYQRKKSVAKNYILKVVTSDDLPEVQEWLDQRKDELLHL